MYKKQMKLQRILCLALVFVCALAFVYSLGIMTDLYDSLYGTFRRGKTSVTGAEIYNDMQGFNKTLLHGSIGMLLLCVVLFITNTHNRRKYYISNYIATGLVFAGSAAAAVWAHAKILVYRGQFQKLDFPAIQKWLEKNKFGDLFTESTFWFDVHYFVFGLTLLISLLLIVNAIWKIRLMSKERALLGSRAALDGKTEVSA